MAPAHRPPSQPPRLPLPAANRRVARRLLAVTACAFGFVFALVPLYDALCRATGLNGKSFDTTTALPGGVDRSRLVTVEFTASPMPGLTWEVRPEQVRLSVHPGEPAQASYRVRNTGKLPLTARAIPSISPGLAALHFHKIECFCFSQQTLQAGEERLMPLSFIVSPDLPAETGTLTLSYAFFDAAPR